jgi:dTDP-4-amino-4,6-dideoxy-D-galactose acyltransferase
MSNFKNEPCELLSWDTNFFGFRIGRVSSDVMIPEQVDEIDLWCQQHKINCLFFLARLDNPLTIKLAEEHNFHLVDVRVTLDWKKMKRSRQIDSMRLRTAQHNDVSSLSVIARKSYYDTRFFYDEQFPRYLSEGLYETWIKRSIEGYANIVLVAVSDRDLPVGYISCHLDENLTNGRIGLVGVNQENQNQHIGKTLIFGALDWFENQGVQNVTVVTQARNFSAQRLYQRCGFLTQSVQLWYHKWYVELDN